MRPAIAIVGMACCYPDARSPHELWDNVLAQRQAFRRLPAERLCLDDYLATDPQAPDCTYVGEAALIVGYDFDRVRFRVAGSTFRTTDLSHWLALDVAAQALADAGFPEGEGLPRDTTGVLLGNTLTGEFARANLMRLRWPYVRRTLAAVLAEQGWSRAQQQALLTTLEAQYKAPFPPVGEESLAGGLSNTIAGRICNYFDLKGGGYTVDGACASSLLAVATACNALMADDLDVAVAGGVDLSLDPFEIVGFAKTGALAPEQMRVYDARSAGFWPGEGCGFVVLMRHADAVAQGRRIYAVIRGWGISSDGHGGMTRPEVGGQLLALQRAYRRAGFGIDTVTYFEGHGTGTSVGDATELQVLSQARRAASNTAAPAYIGSIKANIGHTKAAAGVAGLIKATLALHAQILPPTTGCEQPHAALTGAPAVLQVLPQGVLWPGDRPLRAGVSAMGFGGINTHVVLENSAGPRRQSLHARERALLRSAQDAELVLLSAATAAALRQQVQHLRGFAAQLARAEVTDLAACLAQTLTPGEVRAAMVVATPAELARHLDTLHAWLSDGVQTRLELHAGLYLGAAATAPRLGWLFPGQGSPAHGSGGAWRRRFAWVDELYARADLPTSAATVATEVAQPAIVTASLAGLQTLQRLGLSATVAVGHSLGELTALHWAGAFDETALLRLARVRGQAMAALGSPTGAMASIGAGPHAVEALLQGDAVVLAGLNAPHQTVIAGEASAVAAVVARARAQHLRAVPLPVSHAFHSPLVAAAVPALAAHLRDVACQPLQRTVISTVTGAPLPPDTEIAALLCRQVTAPVRFSEAVANAEVDLWLEVGPGQVLSALLAECVETPAIALDAGGPSLRGLLRAVGAAFVLGAPVDSTALFAGRFVRPFDLAWQPRFFVNPCELAPRDDAGPLSQGEVPEGPAPAQWRQMVGDAGPRPAPTPSRRGLSRQAHLSEAPHPLSQAEETALDIVRRLVAERAELPVSAVRDESRLLGDLHLNSITVGQVMVEAARRLGLPPPVAPTDYATATVAGAAQALEDLLHTGGGRPEAEVPCQPAGVDTWVRAFTVALVERPLPRRHIAAEAGAWQVVAPAQYPLTASLQQAFARVGGRGVVACLPPEPEVSDLDRVLYAAQTVLARAADRAAAPKFVLVQHGGGAAAALARTLHLEAPEVTTCVVEVPVDHPQAATWVAAEACLARGYTEAHYDAEGVRREPVLRLLPRSEGPSALPLTADDVLVVTGGGKGIAAECALSLARQTGVRLALCGRAQPASDPELAANLARMATAGVTFRYWAVDVTDAAAVHAAVREVEQTLGPVTAILHGAGTNVPQLLSTLNAPALRRTLAPKVTGIQNLLAAVDTDRLRLLVVFSSIIARTGMRGEADYALANAWLTHLTERFQAAHPHCRCLALEWSVWSGVGMGERLGRIDALIREGITPITPEVGLAMLGRLLAQPLPAVSVVVTGRFGEPPTLQVERPELPLLRFLEQPRVYYPGVELISDATVSLATDPYLNDHVLQGERLWPAVMGLEAMAQVAMALAGAVTPPVFADVQFARPVVVAEHAPVTLRIAALARDAEQIEVVLRSSETAFQLDHFRACCRFTTPTPAAVPSLPSAVPVSLDPDRDLYGRLLFQRGRLRRVRRYHLLQATECVAELASDGTAPWFSAYLPDRLVLGDPGVHDATLHAIQACIPHATVLPIAVERCSFDPVAAATPVHVWARERCRDGAVFVYDIVVTSPAGHVHARWDGLRLRQVGALTLPEVWPVPLLGPYLERRSAELVPGAALTVRLTCAGPAEGSTCDDIPVWKRSDGKPLLLTTGGTDISRAHAGPLTLVVTGPGPLGCDVEPIVPRASALWQDLLGPERFQLAKVACQESGEDLDTTATRVWAAGECLKKAGAMVTTPLVLDGHSADGWLVLRAGHLAIATVAVAVQGYAGALVLALLRPGRHEPSDDERGLPCAR